MPKIFTVTLTGTQETPPNASPASGAGTIQWDPATNTLTYDFTIRGLDFGPASGQPPSTATTADDVKGMHFHSGARGTPGPIVFGQYDPAQDADLVVRPNPADSSWTVHGVWGPTDFNPNYNPTMPITNFTNVPITNFAAQLDQAPFGSDALLYWNVHTMTFPEGELRGQLVAADTII